MKRIAVDVIEAEDVWDGSTNDSNWLDNFQRGCSGFINKNKTLLMGIFNILVTLAISAYLIAAVLHNAKGAVFFLVLTTVVILWKLYKFVKTRHGKTISTHCWSPLSRFVSRIWPFAQWVVYPGLVLAVVLYGCLILRDTRQLQSLLGLVCCFIIPLLTCKHPTKIRWRPVLWGLALQCVLGVATLRWRPGYLAMKWLSDQINTFLNYALEGAALAFGDPFFLLHPLAMMVLPIIIYVSAVTGILYWMGAIQSAVCKLGFIMRITMGTTGVESVSIILNIFLSVAESAVMMKPYIPKMTSSEFYTLLMGSHASIAGFAYPLFVMVGVDGHHLLTASLMSAPAAVAISKLNYPETEESAFKSEDDCVFEVSTADNPGIAMTEAATIGGKTAASMLVQIIACFSIFAFMDVCIGYIGSRIGIELSFQIIFANTFMPVAFALGVPWAETGTVASILGLKLTINEILAYFDLGALRRAGQLSERASMLTTYAICGFSSFGTMAIFVGVWSTVAPSRATEVAKLIFRVYINTNLSCFLTACVAGIIYSDEVSWNTEEPSVNIGAFIDLLPSYKTLLAHVGY